MTSHSDYRLQLLLVKCWDSIVGPSIAAVTLVTAVTEGVVTVLVPHQGWLVKLEPKTSVICEQLNHALLAPGAIVGIRWCEAMPRPKEAAHG